MKQFLYKIVVYGLLSLIFLNLVAFLSLYFMGKSYLYKPEFVKNGVSESQFDYVVLGSSTGLTTLDTKQIDSVTGKKGLNISIDDTSMSTHYLMLKHFYASGKKTNCLVLTITPWDSSDPKPTLNNNDYRFLPYVWNDYVYDYYSEMEYDRFKTLTLSRYFPMLGVGYYNVELFYPSLLTALQPEKRNRFDDKGNYSYPEDGPQPTVTKYSESAMNIKNPFYKRIKEFCIEHKIKLVLYQSPIYNVKITAADSYNLINHSDLLKDPTLFYDNIHVNNKGRKVCSQKLAQFLAEESKR
jgi:hypothetical protein